MSISRKIDMHHAALQAFHWGGSGSLWCYVTVLLLSLGFNNTYVGTLTGIALLVPIAVQPVLSSLVDRSARLTSRGMAIALTAVCLGSAAALWVFLSIPAAVTLCVILIGVAMHMVPPFFNAMVMDYSRRGVAVNFGLGRGIGSISYAVFCLSLGLILEKHSPVLVIPVFLATVLGQAVFLYTFRYPLPPLTATEEQSASVLSLGRLLKKYPAFTVLLLGCAFLQGSHNTLNTYMIHVAEKVGAGEGLMGTLMAIGACMELPSMALFLRIRRKVPLKWLLRICGIGFLMKCVLFSLAQTATLLYVGSALQFMELGLFVPCTVCYVSEKLDSANQVKGQGLIHVCSNGLGPALIAYVCGRLTDISGMGSTLTFLCITALLGCVITWVATSRLLDKEAFS